MKTILLSSLMTLLMIHVNGQNNEALKENLDPGIYANIQTPKGDILLDLEYEKVPMTVANFVGLAEGTIENNFRGKGEPFFDGLTFHRVIDNFMIQGGDPDGNGQGGPGYKFQDEFHPDLKHDRAGTASMANAGPGTNGSQFFITHKETPWLDNKHSVFGYVEAGMDVVNRIAQGDQMESVRIIRVGDKAENFDAARVFEEEQHNLQSKKAAEAKKERDQFIEQTKADYPGAKMTEEGLFYIIEEEGTGPKPQQGQQVSVHYKGTFTNGEKFDASYDRGEPIRFPVGQGQVIKGWDQGLMLLKEGAKAKFIIPYWLAYGKEGRGPIPAKATLIFDVELVKVGQ